LIRPGELVYRLVVAVDIESYSKLNTLGQYEVQADLGDLLEKAATRAELDRETWDREIRGDGELSVLPADTDVAWVVARLTWEPERALSERRAHRARRPPLRLRVAMHYGTLTQGRFGPVGQAPIVVSRLLDARIARRALAESTERDLVLIVSANLYHDVVETGFYGLDATGSARSGSPSKGQLIAATSIPRSLHRTRTRSQKVAKSHSTARIA
jgi:hypothetical protein